MLLCREGGIELIVRTRLPREGVSYWRLLVSPLGVALNRKRVAVATTTALKLARAHTGRDKVALCADQPFFAIHDWFIGSSPLNGPIEKLSLLERSLLFAELASLAYSEEAAAATGN